MRIYGVTIPMLSAVLLNSCGYRFHLPRDQVGSASPEVVEMSVGDRIPVLSQQVFSEFNMLALAPAPSMVTSSDPSVVKVEGWGERTAYARALSAGSAILSYYEGLESVAATGRSQTVIRVAD